MKNKKRMMLRKISAQIWPGILLLVGILFLNGSPAQAHIPAASSGQSEQQIPAPQLAEVNAMAAAAPLAQTVTFNLCASDGTITMPDGATIPVWGYVDTGGGACTPGLVTSLPGPELHVTDGDSVTINLDNALGDATSILFPGQIGVTALSGSPGTFAHEAPAGGSASYTFIAKQGTYLYESGSNPQIQVPMGLYGALIVDPAVPGQAYGDADPAYSYDSEAVMLLSEIDPNLNANPASFNLLDYLPTYWLINGKAYPNTDAIAAAPSSRIRLRYLNVGSLQQVMSALGAYQTVVGTDGFKINHPYDVIAQTIPSGQTADLLIDAPPIGATIGVFNRNLRITNGAPGPNHSLPGGGMMTFVESSGLNFNDYAILSYGGNQDNGCSGPVTVEDGGASVHITGNCWKKIDLNYDVTPNTVIEFDFQSSVQGEIHGIGFDNDDVIATTTTFQLYGSQTWGIQDYRDYAGSAPNTKHYTIPAGLFMTGTGLDLTFANDDDSAGLGESVFSNVVIYEQPPLELIVDGVGYVVENYGGAGQNPPGAATVTIEDNGNTLHIIGNGWRRITLPYNVTANTVLEFDFQSSAEGEIHGIGFDTDDTVSASTTYRVYGSQSWGIPATPAYSGSGVQHFTIPVGNDFTGSMMYLIFANDHDVASPTAESVFSNITIHE